MTTPKTQVDIRKGAMPPQDHERALALRAILGDSLLASKAAREHGIIISASSIDKWIDKNPQEFGRLQESRLSAIRQDVIRSSRALLAKRDVLANKALDALGEGLDVEALTAPQLAAILRAVDVGRVGDAEQIRKLSTEAVAPAERQSYQELVLKLARTGVITVEGTAVEEED